MIYLAITITVCVVFSIYSIWLRTKKGKEFNKQFKEWDSDKHK